MKLSELRPCDECGKPIAPLFYVVDVQQAMVNPDAANRTLGLAHVMGGMRALGIAEAMGPDANDAVKLLPKDMGGGRLLLCQACGVNALGVALDRVGRASETEEGAT